jgi:zinc transport system substrate-binding protein
VSALALTAAVSTGCSRTSTATAGAAHRVDIAASFYPLAFVAERVGGDRVAVTSLTKPGAEPHDLELSPREVAAVADAGVVLYLSKFQPAVDAAVGLHAAKALDAAAATPVDLTINNQTGAGAPRDPHFWLDPLRLAKVGDALAERLAAVDQAGATAYRANAVALRSDLTAVDAEFRAGLQHCTSRRLVTTHSAFAYLARAYQLTQVGITGNDPEAEPNAADIARVTDLVRREHVTTIFSEPLVSSAIADTIARETSAQTAVLDPVEGLNPAKPGATYLTVMRSNLVALRAGLGCT